MKICIGGSLRPESRAMVSVLDRGFLYGDGVYETFRLRRGRPLFLTEHLSRLARSCRIIGLPLPWSAALLKNFVRRTIAANRREEAALRIQVSRGIGPLGFDTRGCGRPTLVILERPLHPVPPSFYERGVTAAIVKTRRNHPSCLPPAAKSTNCLNGILARREAARLGAFEGIQLNLGGEVTEGTVSNVFAVKSGRVLTPALSCGILAGVTRAFVLKLARSAGFHAGEKSLDVRALERSDELFLTNSLFEILPVTRLKTPAVRRVGNGKVGPVTRRLMQLYGKYVESSESRVGGSELRV